jgi:LmbE family N-acetylglucosaminyl deacetylase
MRAQDMLPIPDVLAMRRVVAFAPHPDDNEIGAGATLAQLIECGAEVHWVVASDGAVGSFGDPVAERLADRRREEQERAMRLLGGSRLAWLGFRDMTLAQHEEALRGAVMGVIRSVRPDLVMAPDPWCPYESHPDHRTLGHAVATAAAMAAFPAVHPEAGSACDSPNVAFYGTAWPNTRVDAARWVDRKMEAILAHESQFPGVQGQMVTLYLRTKMEELGQEVGVGAAEAFKVLTPYHLHFFPDAWRS